MRALSGSSPPLRRGTLFEGEDMGLLELVNFMGEGSDLSASSLCEKKPQTSSKFSGPLEEIWICFAV